MLGSTCGSCRRRESILVGADWSDAERLGCGSSKRVKQPDCFRHSYLSSASSSSPFCCGFSSLELHQPRPLLAELHSLSAASTLHQPITASLRRALFNKPRLHLPSTSELFEDRGRGEEREGRARARERERSEGGREVRRECV